MLAQLTATGENGETGAHAQLLVAQVESNYETEYVTTHPPCLEVKPVQEMLSKAWLVIHKLAQSTVVSRNGLHGPDVQPHADPPSKQESDRAPTPPQLTVVTHVLEASTK